MLDTIPLTTATLMLALGEYLFFTIRVGGQRARFGVQAPAVIGNEIWERYYRVQQNTLEQLIILVPAALAFGTFVGDLWAAIGVAVFVLGRALYYTGYVAEPGKRGPGMVISLLANVVLLVGGLVGAVLALV